MKTVIWYTIFKKKREEKKKKLFLVIENIFLNLILFILGILELTGVCQHLPRQKKEIIIAKQKGMELFCQISYSDFYTNHLTLAVVDLFDNILISHPKVSW